MLQWLYFQGGAVKIIWEPDPKNHEEVSGILYKLFLYHMIGEGPLLMYFSYLSKKSKMAVMMVNQLYCLAFLKTSEMTEVKIPDAGGEDTMTMVDVGGFIQPNFLRSAPEIKRIFDHVPNFQFREDDLMLCTFAKTGTNWMYEILTMILKRTAERVKTTKTPTMIECVTAEEADTQPSPRVINCHYPPKYLPLSDMKAKQIKTVLCVRNPKDTAVSYYNHIKGLKLYNYGGKWENWIPVYSQGKLEYGKYTEFLLEWQRLVQDEPGFPLHIMYYEDLKKNGKEEMKVS